MKSPLYTFTGDTGTTSLVGGTRVSKDNIRIEAYGTIDELNSFVGMLAPQIEHSFPDDYALMRMVQHKLFNIGAYLATENAEKPWGIDEENLRQVEAMIDEHDAQLPKMQSFVLPGSTAINGLCHVCRTVCRRAELRAITLASEAPVDALVLRFLNRLSDYFFVFARFNNWKSNIEEFFWKKGC